MRRPRLRPSACEVHDRALPRWGRELRHELCVFGLHTESWKQYETIDTVSCRKLEFGTCLEVDEGWGRVQNKEAIARMDLKPRLFTAGSDTLLEPPFTRFDKEPWI